MQSGDEWLTSQQVPPASTRLLTMKKSVFSALILAAFAAACDGTSLPDVGGSDGAIRFDFAGTQSGSFTAQGDGITLPRVDQEWAVGVQSQGWIGVSATRASSGGLHDQFSFAFPVRTPPYTVGFDWSRCDADASCPGGVAILGYPQGAPGTGDAFSF